MNILLDIYLEGNLGDDLFLESIVSRYPEHHFFILTNLDYSDFKRKHPNLKIIKLNKYFNYGISKLKIKTFLLKKIIQTYNIQSVVCIGGSIFIEFEGWEKLFLERNNLWKYMKEKNKKVFIIGSNFGPFHSQVFYEKYNKTFNYVEDICFRDKYSFDLFKDRKNVRLETDVIMGFPISTFLSSEEKNSIGISVINLKGRKKLENLQGVYIKKILGIINHFTLQKKNVYLISFCEREGDEAIIETIMEKVERRNDQVNKIYYKGNIEDFLKKFSKLEQIVACRFHSVILSYIFKKEIYAINYSEKSTNFITDMHLNIPMSSIEETNLLTPDVIEKSFKKAKYLSQIIKSGEKQYFALDQFLLHNE